ncbi:MAG: T9SS type A sorting domain-containing protein [Candidatus Desantisbacteria bacterium]
MKKYQVSEINRGKLTKGRHSCPSFKSGFRMAIIAILCLLPTIGIAASGLISPTITPILPTKELLPPSNDCKILKKKPPTMAAPLLKAPPYNGDFYDTSNYMVGKIAVGIILPESTGNTENWTQDEVTKVISKIKAAMDWWASIEPDAHLSFYYDIHTPFDGTQSVKIASEPIATSSEKTWINQVMNAMGYTNPGTGLVEDYFYCVFDYNNHIRDMLNTHWAFTIFVADSSNDTDGNFPDGMFAYAYLGGPFMVMTYDNGNYGIENMDSCCAHETGHVFYALDEYSGASSKTEYSGYLNVINGNYESAVPCIMKGLINPFANHQVCDYTRGQLGLWDTDTDNILDVIDSSPNIFLTPYSPDPTSNQTPTYIGSASVTAVPNKNPQEDSPLHDITINTILQVEYRINNGSWSSATASDGLFDEPEEDFTFTTSILSDGTYTFVVRAIDSAGNISNYSTDISDILHDAQLNLNSVVVYPVPFRQSTGDTHIIFKGLTNDANIRIYDLAGDIIREKEHASIIWKWPVIDEGISSGVYFFVVTEEGKGGKVGRIVIIR